MAEAIIKFLDRGYEMRLIDNPTELTNVVDSDTAVVMLSHANYRTGYLHDMSAVTAQVHERGAQTIWDLAQVLRERLTDDNPIQWVIRNGRRFMTGDGTSLADQNISETPWLSDDH